MRKSVRKSFECREYDIQEFEVGKLREIRRKLLIPKADEKWNPGNAQHNRFANYIYHQHFIAFKRVASQIGTRLAICSPQLFFLKKKNTLNSVGF